MYFARNARSVPIVLPASGAVPPDVVEAEAIGLGDAA
jgi:hypothetical protein